MVWNIPRAGSLPLERWHDIIGDTTYAVAILDRVVHKADRLEVSGESLHKQSSHAKRNSAK
jgi:DNA replication protein DnaC